MFSVSMKGLKVFIFLILAGIPFCCLEVSDPDNQPSGEKNYQVERTFFRFMFYNVENLFDPFDDSLKNDDEFLPGQHKYWTWSKFQEKINNTYKVIVAVGGWEPPELIGLCEIENHFVLRELVEKSPFAAFNYRIIHQESPDHRGIDVALLFNPDKFQLLTDNYYSISFPFDTSLRTRDILYAKGIVQQEDTLHVFVNHWPSRWGGQLESEPKRLHVAQVLKNATDSIFSANPNAQIIITGDFNDTPENTSIRQILNANNELDVINNAQLYNLCYRFSEQGLGTHKYQGKWAVLDQFIISGNLLQKENTLFCKPDDVHIYNPKFLLENDETYLGSKPYRTYIGYRFNGGYSDHLPIFLDLRSNH